MGILGGIWDWLDVGWLAWTLRLVYVAAAPQTLFVVGFGLRNTWWTSMLGWGQFTKALAMAVLLDMTVGEELFGWTPQAWTQFVIVLLILIGASLQCLAWLIERRVGAASDRADRADRDLYA